MSTRLSYDIMNEKGEWGNVIDIPSNYASDLKDEIGFQYGKRVIITVQDIEFQRESVQHLIQEDQKYLADNQKYYDIFEKLYVKSENAAGVDKALERMQEYQNSITFIQDEINCYQQINIALNVLSQSKNLTISYFYG